MTSGTTLAIPEFRTARLVLRAPRAEDMPAFAAFMGSERSRFVGGPNRPFWDAARAFGHIAGSWVLRGYGPHVWCLADGTPIGHGGPWFPMAWPEPEFGWCLWADEHEGRGYATEAMETLRDWAFGPLGLDTAVAYMDADNHASQRLATRLGGRPDPQARPPMGDPDDSPLVIHRFTPEGRA